MAARYAPGVPHAIRHATLADLDAIARVHLAGWMDAYRGILPEGFLSTLDHQQFAAYSRPRLEKPDPSTVFLVAESEDGIGGFARAGPTRSASPTGDALPPGFASGASAELYAIYLEPQTIGTGLGKALLKAAAHEMLSRGHRAMCVWVLTGNARARAWYQRRGAIEVSQGPITLGGVQYPQTALVWRNLPALCG